PAAHPLALPSFPTRRSSDLTTMHAAIDGEGPAGIDFASSPGTPCVVTGATSACVTRPIYAGTTTRWPTFAPPYLSTSVLLMTPRSEEHTSELQSRENLVCRLLLEKKNRLAYLHIDLALVF